MEIITPEVEWKMGMDSLKAMAEDEQKLKKEALRAPIKYLRDDLSKIAMFINILIKKLDSSFHNIHLFADCEEWYGADMFKDIQVKYTGDERDKELLLFQFSQYLTSLDYISMRLYENEYLEIKAEEIEAGSRKKFEDEYIKKINKDFFDLCKKSKYHQEYYKEPEPEEDEKKEKRNYI